MFPRFRPNNPRLAGWPGYLETSTMAYPTSPPHLHPPPPPTQTHLCRAMKPRLELAPGTLILFLFSPNTSPQTAQQRSQEKKIYLSSNKRSAKLNEKTSQAIEQQ